MAQLTPTGLIKVFGLVTAIMVIPMVGGAVAGLILDETLGTAPLYVLIGLAVGTLISAIGIGLVLREGARRGYTDGTRRHDT